MKTVGICITMTGATLVVVEPSRPGWRVVAVAEIDWPEADSVPAFTVVNSVVKGNHPTGPDLGRSPAAARLLRRARRQLKLPNWQAVAVTTTPDDWCHPDSPSTAILFAQADLVRCWAVDPDRARTVADGALATLDTVLDPGLAQVSATGAARLAAGAAIAALRPAAELVPASDPATELVPVTDPATELVPSLDPATGFDETPVLPRIGWAVQRVADLDRAESGNPIPG